MDRKLLERFFYDGIMPREMCCPHREDYRENLQLCSTVEKEFLAHLSPELKTLFEDYKGYALRLTTLENEEHFIQGMSLGIRMTAEAFTLEERK